MEGMKVPIKRSFFLSSFTSKSTGKPLVSCNTLAFGLEAIEGLGGRNVGSENRYFKIHHYLGYKNNQISLRSDQ